MAESTPMTTHDKHDDKKADEHKDKAAAKPAEDLTPTPTQAEMDKIMSGLSDEDLAKAKKPEAKEGAEAKHPTPTSTPPHMTQEENDAAMAAAAPGSVPPEGSTDPQKAEREAKRKEEEKRKKDMEAEARPAGGYKTR